MGHGHTRSATDMFSEGPAVECATKNACRLQQFWEKSSYLVKEVLAIHKKKERHVYHVRQGATTCEWSSSSLTVGARGEAFLLFTGQL